MIRPLWVLPLVAACTDVGLYSPTIAPNLANRLAVSANLCTDDPGQRAFPVRVALLVDGSMTATAIDPGGRRADALQEIISRYSSTESHQFAVIRFDGGARDLTGGFTQDRAVLDEAVNLLRQPAATPGRDVLAGLRSASNAIAEVLLGQPAGINARTTFIVALLTTGRPVPDTGDAELSSRVVAMRNHVVEFGGAAMRLHALLIKDADPLLASRAQALYEDVALAGNGAYVGFDLPQQIDLAPVDLTAGDTLFVKKQILVLNRNALTTPDGVVPDSDGDGLSDEEEIELGLDPRAADTDSAGLSDRVEILHRAGGQDPFVPDLPTVCLGLDDAGADRDADGLTDCEERVMGTDPTLFDSDRPADGIPDLVEVLCDTNPMQNDTIKDYDFDGTPNGEECRAHTNARGDDGEARWSLAYRYREYEQGVQNRPFSSQPTTITGAQILSVSNASTAGAGTLDWDPDADALRWKDPGEMLGQPVTLPDDDVGEVTLSSQSVNRQVRVRYARRLLPRRAAQDLIVVGKSRRSCFSFRAKNISLVETLDTGDGPGRNDLYVYFAQAPEQAPDSPGLFRVALIRTRFLEPDLRTPSAPEVVLDDGDFVLLGL